MTKSSTLERQLLLGVASFAMLLSAAPAYAQTPGAGETEEDVVVATGIRQSIQESLDLKRNSSSIIEAITAEDIGKLPDVSIADSLARLPGVTAQRVRGRAQQISIRGLGPDFSIALLNGREVVSAGNNRGIEFDVFPSELIAQGVVYKTPDARLATTGVAGAVDLRTVKPLDYTSRQFNVSGKYVINDNGRLNPDFSDQGYRLFGSYIDQNEAGTLGWAIGITNQSNPTQYISRELKTNQFQTGQLADGTYYASDNPRSGVTSRDFERTSVAGTLQFEPDETFAFTVDGFYSDFEDTGIFRGVETPIAGWSGAQLTNSSGSGDFVDSATYAPVGGIVRTDTEGTTAKIYAIGANLSANLSERVRITIDASTSGVDKSDIDYESYAGTGPGILFGPASADPSLRGSLTYTTPSDGAYSVDSSIDYGNPDNIVLTDPGGWGQAGFIKEPQIDDQLNQIRMEAEYETGLSFIDGISAGLIYTDRQKTFDSNEAFLREGSGFVDGVAGIPNFLGATDTGSLGFPIAAYDPTDLITNGTYRLDPTAGVQWSVEEKILTPYVYVEIDTELGDMPVRGNIGAQYADVEQSSSISGGFLEDSYGDFLPSANLSIEIMDQTFFRLGAAKSVTRPRMDQLRASGALELNSTACPDTNGDGIADTIVTAFFNPAQNQTCFKINGGNPFLRPYKSTSLDAAIEKYFSEGGAVTLAVFNKDVDDYIVSDFDLIEGGAAVAPFLTGTAASTAGASLIGLSGPVNAESANLKGFELALRLPLEDVFSALEGFGLNAAYTYTDNSLDFQGQTIPIPGYSKETFSGEVYYEQSGWRARVNTRYRSGFLAEIQEFDGSLNGQQALSEFIIDAQLGYEFQSGKLEGFSVNLEAYNLTDEPFRTENDLDGNGAGTATFVSRHEDYGRTFNITLAKKF